MYDITTIVATYNSGWDELRKTIVSAIKQKRVIHQIIVTDDGSKEDFFDIIEDLFKKYKFNDYILLGSEVNHGTCKNCIKALEKTNSRYIKMISPGDYYYSDEVLYEWLNTIKEKDADISFGENICYKNNGCYNIVTTTRCPQNTDIYEGDYNYKNAYLNLVFLDDAFFGSGLIVKSELMLKYLKATVGVLKYAEDMAFRSMIVDGAKVIYYKKPVIWYEYGTGISTNTDSKWADILKQEKRNIYLYMYNNNNLKGFERLRFCIGLKALCNNSIKLLKYLIYPELIYWKLKKNSLNKKTISEANLKYLTEL